jgi:hypothetical protein
LNARNRQLFAAVEEGKYGFQALTFDAAGARRQLGADAVLERPSLEDVMVLLAGSAAESANPNEAPGALLRGLS